MRDEMRDDAPHFVILRQGVHRTRDDRLCDCGRVIPAGAGYERVCGTEDGHWFTHVSCAKPQPWDDCPHPFPADPFEPLTNPHGLNTKERWMPGPLKGKERAEELRRVQADIERFLRGGRETRGWAHKLSITEMHGLMVLAVENVTGMDAEHARREGEALAEEYTQGWWSPLTSPAHASSPARLAPRTEST